MNIAFRVIIIFLLMLSIGLQVWIIAGQKNSDGRIDGDDAHKIEEFDFEQGTFPAGPAKILPDVSREDCPCWVGAENRCYSVEACI